VYFLFPFYLAYFYMHTHAHKNTTLFQMFEQNMDKYKYWFKCLKKIFLKNTTVGFVHICPNMG